MRKRGWQGRFIFYLFLLAFVIVFLLSSYMFFLRRQVFLGPDIDFTDFDGDGVYDLSDNCPYSPNPDQHDSNDDDVGDACFHDQGDCGNFSGGIVECFCGDKLVENFTMVVGLRNRAGGNICTNLGLTIGRTQWDNPLPFPVALECNGNEIKGDGQTTNSKGIYFSNSHVPGVSVDKSLTNCKVHEFDIGVHHSGSGPAFVLNNSEIFDNEIGIGTGGSSYAYVLNSSIHDNSDWGIVSDETLRYTIQNSHIFNNKDGINIACQTPWTEDLNYVADDLHFIDGNVIENNQGDGLMFAGCSNSTVSNNIIRNNKDGFYMPLGRQMYRVWEGDKVVQQGYGRDRTNYNNITNNTIYGNSMQDFKINWATESIGENIDYGGQYYEPYNNSFENNNVSGKDILYYYGLNNTRFANLDIHAFICMGCTNLSLENSKIREMYFAYSSDNDDEYDVEHILSENAYYTIYKTYSSGIGFNYIRIWGNRFQRIFEEHSQYNIFDNVIDITGECDDTDGDGYGVCPACGVIKGCTFDGDDCDDSNENIYPGAREILNDLDDDCNGLVDMEDLNLFLNSCLADLNHDLNLGFLDIDVFNLHFPSIDCGYYGHPDTDWCYSADINRDGVVNDIDKEILSFVIINSPGACICSVGPELCDGYDNDCDREFDEGCP